MKSKVLPECHVPASIALLLRVSRLAGVAPVHLVTKHNQWNVRVFPTLNYYSYLLIIIINVLTILAVVSDLSVPPERTVRMQTETRCVVWIADVVAVGLTANIGVFTAPTQMARLINNVNRIQKINSELKSPSLPLQLDSVQYRIVIASLFTTAVIMVADFFDVLYSTFVEKRDLLIAATYSCYYMSYIVLQLLEIQFIMMASYVLSSMKLVNFGLSNILQQRDFYTSVDIKMGSRPNRVYPQNKNDPKRHVNEIIDSIAVVNNTFVENNDTTWTSKDVETIRRLSLSYGSVCEVVRQVDTDYGTVLLLILGSFLLHLVVTPYYMITSLFDHSTQTIWNKYGKPTLQLFWCLFHTINLVMLIEPCHRTLIEVDVTKELVSHLMCTTKSPYDSVSIELKLFCKRLTMNQISYAPLNVCTLKRSLIATIFGNITTYLVVIIQL